MKPIQLHPLSLLVGVACAGIAFVAMAQTPQPAQAKQLAVSAAIRAHDMVQIQEGVPFVVPAGRLFVLTALGTRDGSTIPNSGTPNYVYFAVDGQDEVIAMGEMIFSGPQPVGNGTSMKPVPPGFAVPEGSTVTVRDRDNSDQEARAWGRLDDA